MEDRFAYGLNPKKIGAVSAYLCDPASAPAEFLLTKSQYQAETGRAVERGALFFQIRQAFFPGEVTPEEANKIGYCPVLSAVICFGFPWILFCVRSLFLTIRTTKHTNLCGI